MMHDLPLFPWHVGDSFLAIEELRLCAAIMKMLNFPPVMRRAVNSARGRGLNAMFA